MDKKQVGAFLKELRKEKNLTQQQFACDFSVKFYGDIGLVSDAAISKWERGEAIPNIDDMQKLSQFYGISMDELLNGQRNVDLDLFAEYPIADPQWFQNYGKNDNLYEIRENQELKIEARFKCLLRKLIDGGLTATDNKEFDFLVKHFYTVYIDCESDDEDKIIAECKFQIVKMSALMHESSIDDKFWEAYKMFECDFMQSVRQDICDAIEDAADIMKARISNLENYEKDMLLAVLQIVNVTNRYKPNGYNNDLYEKVYHRPYDEEMLTKNAMRVLVECGARLNPLLLGYEHKKTIQIDILERLLELYAQFKKPLLIPVFEESKYRYFQIENTLNNRELFYKKTKESFNEEEYADLERRLYAGERILEKHVPEWIGGKTEYDMIKYMFSVLQELSLEDYVSARNNVLTSQLISELDNLSLKEIRTKFFTRSDIA